MTKNRHPSPKGLDPPHLIKKGINCLEQFEAIDYPVHIDHLIGFLEAQTGIEDKEKRAGVRPQLEQLAENLLNRPEFSYHSPPFPDEVALQLGSHWLFKVKAWTFQTVVIDPPWNERGGGKIKRGADRHYDLIKKTPDILKTILSCPYWNRIEDNAHLYLWTTNTFLPDALGLMEWLGFKYKANFVWIKPSYGLGQYFRGQHELCLFGTRGKKPTEPRTERRDLSSVIEGKKGEHSEKPLSSFELIENRSKGGYLELFSRCSRKGWTVWGKQVRKT